jgi:adenylate kinase family enzyme
LPLAVVQSDSTASVSSKSHKRLTLRCRGAQINARDLHPQRPPLQLSRIVIFGNSGSGKSTLAAALAREAGLEHLDLDTLAWDKASPTQRRSLIESRNELSCFIQAHNEWVIEGCYSDLLSLAISHCDKLIFLNPGIEACIRNCRSRPWEPHKYPIVEAQNQNLEMLIRWVREYETRDDEFSLRRHRQLFAEFDGEKVEYADNIQMPNKAMHPTREDARG